jgi:hypothetical protein
MRSYPTYYGITQSSFYWGAVVAPEPPSPVLLGVEVLLLPDVEVLLLLTLAAS